MSFFSDPNRIPERYGIFIAGGFIIYFVLMFVLGQGSHVELRLFNLPILGAGVYFGLKKFKAQHGKHINYFRALATGVAISAIGTFLFSVFFFFFLKLNPDFMTWIMENEPMGRYLNPYMLSFIILLEGVFSGLLVTFVLLNWIDTDEVTE
jgi:ABC-type Fe3+-siderophore transport system permease subunit